MKNYFLKMEENWGITLTNFVECAKLEGVGKHKIVHF